MADTPEFSRTKTLAQTCAIETFEKPAALAFFKITPCWMTTIRKHFPYKLNITSFAVKTQLTSSQWKLLNSNVSSAWQAITDHSRFESASRQWCLVDLTNQRDEYHWKMSKRFFRRPEKLTFTKFLLEHFTCSSSALGKKILNLIYTKLCADFENAARQTF